MAQAISRWSLTAEAQVRARVNLCGICGGQSGTWDRLFFESLDFQLSLSFHHGSPCSYITCDINNKHVCGSSSETSSHDIDTNNYIVTLFSTSYLFNYIPRQKYMSIRSAKFWQCKYFRRYAYALHNESVSYCNVLGVLHSRWNFIALQKSIHYS
jgi:hypothetical protein